MRAACATRGARAGGRRLAHAGKREGEWNAALQGLAGAHAELLDAAPAFPAAELDQTVGDERDRPLGAGVSYTVMLHGIAKHHAYHAGQIALLKKSFG